MKPQQVKQLEATCKELEEKLEDAGAMRVALEASKSELARNLSELEQQVDERARALEAASSQGQELGQARARLESALKEAQQLTQTREQEIATLKAKLQESQAATQASEKVRQCLCSVFSFVFQLPPSPPPSPQRQRRPATLAKPLSC